MARKKKSEIAADAAAANAAQGTESAAGAAATPAVLPGNDTAAVQVGGPVPSEVLPLMGAWYEAKQKAAAAEAIIEAERAARAALIKALMPTAVEGTHEFELGGGYTLKLKYPFKRDMEQAQFQSVFSRLPDGLATQLIRWKPELETRAYRALPEDQRTVLEECLVTKPGSPSLELIAPVFTPPE